MSPHSSWAVPEAHLTPVKENHAVHAQSTRILLRSVLSTHGVQESPRSRDARTHHIHRARLGDEGPWGGDGGFWLEVPDPRMKAREDSEGTAGREPPQKGTGRVAGYIPEQGKMQSHACTHNATHLARGPAPETPHPGPTTERVTQEQE